jgi:hypothetical protein
MEKSQRLISVTFAVLLVFVSHVVALAATKQEIIEKWELLKPKYDTPIFITLPSVTAPYAPGQLSEEFIQDGINSINFVRFMVGLPDDVEIKSSLSEEAQYGAVLMAAAGYHSHQPSKPDDMDQKFYDKGLANTRSSNIIATRQGSLASQVYWYIHDGDRKNISDVGHRLWILNPTLKYASFGSASKNERIRGTLPIFDMSRKNVKLPQMILCPNSGDWPSGYMRNDMPWSVQLNRSYYLTPKFNEARL